MQLIALAGRKELSNNADLNIKYNKVVTLAICIAYKKIVRTFESG